MKQNYDKWDLLFEQISGDTSWMPARVVRVMRPEISYSFDPQGNPSFCVVQRVDNELADYRALIDEVMRAHAPCGVSHFPVTAASMSTAISIDMLPRTRRRPSRSVYSLAGFLMTLKPL